MKIDPVDLTQRLIQCPSVTPKESGALVIIESTLMALGFQCHRLPFSEEGTDSVDNLYARYGAEGPLFVFAGHIDVVPPGPEESWKYPPFAAHIEDNILYGRGAVDMKAAIACFIAAVSQYEMPLKGSVGFLITADEEGPAINGTRKVLKWLDERQEKLHACLIGEPTSQDRLGDMIKVGRRGSLNGRITVHGVQGHVAYSRHADNPIPRLIEFLKTISSHTLDQGTDLFEPSHLEITSIDVGNPATNVIPAQATAAFNIRYNTNHTGESLTQWLKEQALAIAGKHTLDLKSSGDAFYTQPGILQNVIIEAVQETLGITPVASTSGGTSDARFIRTFCPVVEFGLCNSSAHKVNEQASVQEIQHLAEVYKLILKKFFEKV